MSTSTLTAREVFGLGPEQVMVGEGPVARRARVRASESQRTAVMEAMQLLDRAWAGDRRATDLVNEAITTSDLFKSAAGEYLDRMMLADYERETPEWESFAAPTSVRNFKPKTLWELTHNTGALPKVPERTNYPQATTTASERSIQVAKFGEAFGYTFEARLNDEIGELSQVPAGWAFQARATEAELALSQMVNVLTGAPTTAFFNVGNDNLGTGLLNEANLQAAITKLTTKRDANGKLLRAPALQLVVGQGLAFTAERLMTTSEIRITTGSSTVIQPNPFAGKVRLNVVSTLPGTAWFVIPVPQAGRKGPFYVAKLTGYETPDLRWKNDQGQRIGGGAVGADQGSFSDDTIWYRVRHIVGAAQGDPKFTWASDGIA